MGWSCWDRLCQLSKGLATMLIRKHILPGEKGEPVFVAKREHKLLRIGAAAHELGLHPIAVRRWIKAGRIQAVPMGREVRVPRAEVERLVGKIDGRLLVLYGRVSGHGQKRISISRSNGCKPGPERNAKGSKPWYSPILALA